MAQYKEKIMGDRCCACEKNLGFFDSGEPIVKEFEDYKLCYDCNFFRNRLTLAVAKSEFNHLMSQFDGLRSDPNTPQAIKDYFIEKKEAWQVRTQKYQEKEEKKENLSAEIETNLSTMLLTTGSYFEGYQVVKYIDVLCEEVIFKNSFLNRLGAGIEDLGNALSFSETEMSGSGDLIARARAHVKKKFRHSAAKMGANAVLGLEFESSVGAEIVRVAMFGTAVIIQKQEE